MASHCFSDIMFNKSIGIFSFYSLNISLSFSEGLARSGSRIWLFLR